MAPTATQIKINALSRLVKEEGLYRKEAQDIKDKIELMKKENSDPYDIKKMEEVYRDTEQMIPNIRKTIQSTLDGLKENLKSCPSEEKPAAEAKIKEVEKFLA